MDDIDNNNNNNNNNINDYINVNINDDNNNNIDILDINYEYPDINDETFMSNIYKKREYYFHKIPKRININEYDNIKEYRKDICSAKKFKLHNHQYMLSNFINPNTPYFGLILFHGLGTGKTCAAIAISENFKELVKKYNTKIHILVPGPIIRENWLKELIKCTGNTYIKDINEHTNNNEKIKIKNNAISKILQYYKFLSYKGFYKRVLGEKIIDKKNIGDSGKKSTYKKNEEGVYERDIVVDKIYNLNNTLLIIDEAHNLTGNVYGESLKYIIDRSKNLKILLLTATPMKNLADDIIELINFLRPKKQKIERDKIFNSAKNHTMELKTNGLEYFKKYAKGYISHVRGSDPLLFARRVDKGIIPNGLLFTKLIKCNLLPLQYSAYKEVIKNIDDALDRRSEAVSNFIFPGLNNDGTEINTYHGKNGMNIILEQLSNTSNIEKINKLIAIKIKNYNSNIKIKNKKFIYPYNNKTIYGNIFKIKYLKYFSIKFYTALKKLNKLIIGKKGPGLSFIYSNLVKVGIDLFNIILLHNGYLEYQQDKRDYIISQNTICYYCGIKYKHHQKNMKKKI